MVVKHTSPWAQVKQKSVSLRKTFEQLTNSFTTLCTSEADAITGSTLAEAEINAWRQTLQDALGLTERALLSLRQKAMEEAETLDIKLSKALQDAGLALYGQAGLFFVEGIVHLETDAAKGIVKVNGHALTDLSLGKIQAHVLQEVERLKALLTPPDRFLVLLLRGYENEVLQEKKEFGSQIQTAALIWQLALLKQQTAFRSNPTAEGFRPYPREVFRADLYRLLEANLTVAEGKRFRYASGSDTNGAVFTLVPQLGRPAHVGRIWFEHAEN